MSLESTFTIKKCICHQNPDIDCYGFLWLVKRFGEKIFPSIDSTPVEFLPGGDTMPDGRTGDDWLKDGFLVGDMGGGMFDHHQYSIKDNRKDERCATTLIAEFLGIDKNPALNWILRYIAQNDLWGQSAPMDLARLIKDRNTVGKDPLETMKLVFVWLDDAYAAQEVFFKAQEALEDLVTVSELPISEDRKIKIATATLDEEFDNLQTAKAIRFKLKADVIVVKRPTGNVQLFNRTFNNEPTASLQEVIKILRYEEQRKTGKITVTNPRTLAKDGTVEGPGIELWHYIQNTRNGAEMLLNGSFSVENSPTQLTNDEIMRAVLIGVDENYFHPECNPKKCQSCPFYPYGLRRCQKKKA